MSVRNSARVLNVSPVLAQPQIKSSMSGEDPSLIKACIRPQAILEVVRRRGRSWGLLAQYEESRLASSSR